MIGSLWILYSDYIKIQNPIGSFLTSVNLSHWNYGTFSQRISKELWLDIIYTRNIEKNSASLLGLIFISILLINRKIKAPKKIIALSLAFYILPLLIFTNLHIVHNYYQTSNSIFYSVALGISICYVLDWYISKNKFLYITILLLFITSNYYYFYTEYSEKKIQLINAENSRTLSIAEYIKNNTSNEGPIIVFGYDWSSEIAYYSERKSLTIPAWGNFEFEAINDTRKFLSQSPSSYIVCPVENYSKILDLINKKYPESKVKMVSDCTIFLL